MSEFLNIWQEWLIGYIVLLIPGVAIFFGLIVKTFEIKEKRKRRIVLMVVLIAVHTVFLGYYYLQTTGFGNVTKITIAGDWIFAEGVLINAGYEERPAGVRKYHQDPATTSYAQKLVIADKYTGEILKRIDDYQFAYYADNKVFLVPTIVTKSFAVLDCQTLQFERFFHSGELITDMQGYSDRIEKISYDRSWITDPEFSSRRQAAKPYFQVTLTDGSQLFYDVLTRKMIQSTDSTFSVQLPAVQPKKPKREMTLGSSRNMTVSAKFLPKDGFILNGTSGGQTKWTVTADQVFPKIKEKLSDFAENPNCFITDDRYLYFFSLNHAIAIELETGKLRWIQDL